MKTASIFAAILGLLLTGPVGAKSPNESIHVLQKRDYSVKNKLELSLFGGASLADVFTQQYGVGLAIDYHFDEAFALELSWLTCKLPFWDDPAANWGTRYTDSLDEVKKDAQLSPSNADLAMLTNYVGLNVQFSPLYGKWSLFNWALGHADFYLTAGGGVAGTEFKDPRAGVGWRNTGTYFVGNFGLGFRIFLERWFAIRVEVRDYAFAARVKEDVGDGSGTVSTKIRNTVFVTLGLSFLFLGEEPVQIWSPY